MQLLDGEASPGIGALGVKASKGNSYTVEPLYCGHLGDIVKCPV